MKNFISYIMNSAWQTDDKLFMLLRETRQRASTLVV